MKDTEHRESFETTRWSLIQAAVDPRDSKCQVAMEQLCGRYWFPLYAFARRRGHDADDAQDLIQSFFVRLLEKDVLSRADRERGRFRSFLLGSLKNFLSGELAKSKTRRRGGDVLCLSLDFRDAEGRLAHEPADNLSPDAYFHRQWAMEVLQRTLDRLGRRYHDEQQEVLFEDLRGYLAASSERMPYSEVAERRGMSVAAVKVAVHRMRRRYRRILESEIGDTVSGTVEIEAEIQELFNALAKPDPLP